MNEKYGWMITSSTKNIGDDFQCIAAYNFIKNNNIGINIDRESLNSYKGEKIKLIMNGWYMHNPSNWPPSDDIVPLLISLHISNTKQKISGLTPSKVMLSAPNINFLKSNAPVGCRDLYTYKLLKKKRIDSFFSGCLTLTLDSFAKKKGNYICLIDPSEDLVKYVKSKTDREVKTIFPEKNDWPSDYMERIKKAKEILKIYSEAHMVITSRLHGALPSLAMGVPTLLLENRFGDERFEGLKYFLNLATYKDLYSGKYLIDFERPLENPKEYMVLRDNLIKIVNAYINNNIKKVDFDKINQENIKAYKSARRRTINFNKNNKLESIKFREKKNAVRFLIRNIENIIK